MDFSDDLKGCDKRTLLEELYQRYGSSQGWQQRLLFLRKKYSWLIVVSSTQWFKRFVDIVFSGILLVLLSPIFAVIALLIKSSDGGPVLYHQMRIGKWGTEFRMPKFRTMVMDADKLKEHLLSKNEHGNSITFKIKRDPRITRIGWFLRRTSLDELPQLWCVFKGTMSLVGPRPPLPSEVAAYTLEDRRRLDAIPGITCIWQVSGRADIPFAKQVRLDVQYIESQSFWLDLKLLLKTIPAVILGRGAY